VTFYTFVLLPVLVSLIKMRFFNLQIFRSTRTAYSLVLLCVEHVDDGFGNLFELSIFYILIFLKKLYKFFNFYVDSNLCTHLIIIGPFGPASNGSMMYDREQIPIMKNFVKKLKTKNAKLKVMICITPNNRNITAMVSRGVNRYFCRFVLIHSFDVSSSVTTCSLSHTRILLSSLLSQNSFIRDTF